MQGPKCKNVEIVLFLDERSPGYTDGVKKGVKNPAAVALGKLSAASMTPEQRSQNATKAGKVGGAARAESLTPAQRKKIAKNAAKARWAKKDG
jgi:hypothetical protein